MTTDRWLQIEEILDTVLQAEPHQWKTIIEKTCNHDKELRHQVEKYLRHYTHLDTFLQKPVDDGIIEQIADDNAFTVEWIKKVNRIGRYRIIREIAHGGMGRVFLAERDDGQYKQKVALKLLHSDLDSETMQRRFLIERQILASLNHPNIARLLDGGVVETESGLGINQPYLVLEYVEGISIKEYCDTHSLTVHERLQLFLKAAEAVQHAHRNLVVHCDIKPSNILVTKYGEIKLLDFGISRLLSEDIHELPQYSTRTIRRWMTPEYAAPEQIKGERATTAVDVYQLGVLLYELLTGLLPFKRDGENFCELEQSVLEKDPLKPSIVSQNGGTRRMIRGDLDAIILKSLRKEPEARYDSTSALIEDIRLYLSGKPVKATHGNFGYRTAKFVRRHRIGVSVTAGVLLLISILTGFYTHHLTIERDRAEQAAVTAQLESQKAEKVVEFLVNLFDTADPATAQGEQITAREIVEKGVARIDEDLAAQPEIHVEMLKVLGRVIKALGDFNRSTELFEKALIKSHELYGREHLEVAAIAAMLGDAARWNGELEKAELQLRDALEIRLNLIPDDDPDVAITMDRLARVLEMRGNFTEAEKLYRDALTMRERLFGNESDAVSANLNNLGWLLFQMGKLDESEIMLRRALSLRERQNDPPQIAIASNMSNLAVVLGEKGNYTEAEHYYIQALQLEEKLHGDDHPRYTTALSNLSVMYNDLARYEEAAEMFQKVLDNNRRQLGPSHVYVGFALGHLSTSLLEDGRSLEAMPLLEEMLEVFRNAVGEEHRFFARGLMIKGDALYYLNPSQSVAVYDRSIDIYRRVVGDSHPLLAKTLARLGRAHYTLANIEASKTAFNQALDIQRRVLPPHHSDTIWTLTWLGRVLAERGNYDEAEALLREAVEMSQIALPPDHWRRINAHLELYACLKSSNRLLPGQNNIEQIVYTLENRKDFHADQLLARARTLQ